MLDHVKYTYQIIVTSHFIIQLTHLTKAAQNFAHKCSRILLLGSTG